MICDKQVDGNRGKDAVFEEVDSLLSRVKKEEQDANKLGLKKMCYSTIAKIFCRTLLFTFLLATVQTNRISSRHLA